MKFLHKVSGPKFSSSSPNDLLYVFLNLVFDHTQCSDLILNLLSDVLLKSLVPPYNWRLVSA